MHVFGKTMENVKKNGVDVKFVNGRKRLLKLCSKSSFKRFKIFNENLVGIENRKVSLKLDKPFFYGQAVLDLSKVIMYDFHYNFIRKRYKDNAVYRIILKTITFTIQPIRRNLGSSRMKQVAVLSKNLYDSDPICTRLHL